jgi:metallo-beta-lactamase class B
MYKFLLLLFIVSITITAHAQYNIRLVVTNIATKPNDDVYVTGSFNNWNPKDENYKLKPFGGSRKGVVIKDVAPGTYAFKFTRGNMDNVECLADGRELADRVLEISADAILECTIAGWKDDYPEKPKRYSASPQVKIIDTAFIIPQLNRKRRIWLYLPRSYTTSSKNYPVLYMQDGQNLFNDQTAAFGEWGVDECLDSLQKQTGKECIVVGIDNGGDKRMSEYAPYNFTYGNQNTIAEGKQYVDFLVQTLKPYIDVKYRTQKGKDYTFIAGSSMGGLISLYAVLQYPQVFGATGVFSPSLWTSNQIFIDAANFSTTEMHRFYFYAGGKETTSTISLVNDVNKMSDILRKQPNHQIATSIYPLGEHKEKYWRSEFALFYKWLLP